MIIVIRPHTTFALNRPESTDRIIQGDIIRIEKGVLPKAIVHNRNSIGAPLRAGVPVKLYLKAGATVVTRLGDFHTPSSLLVGGSNVTGRVDRSLPRAVVIGAVALVVLLGVPASMRASSCSATGNFFITIGAGSGELQLSADGSASMLLMMPNHLVSETELLPSLRLRGTYQTGGSGPGDCGFQLELTDPAGSKVIIIGRVAFQGSVLLFQAATVPSFGPGLGLRSDTLSGQ